MPIKKRVSENVSSESDDEVKNKNISANRHDWTTEYPYLSRVSGNPRKAYLTLCRHEFSVAHRGPSNVKQHVAGSEHKKND